MNNVTKIMTSTLPSIIWKFLRSFSRTNTPHMDVDTLVANLGEQIPALNDRAMSIMEKARENDPINPSDLRSYQQLLDSCEQMRFELYNQSEEAQRSNLMEQFPIPNNLLQRIGEAIQRENAPYIRNNLEMAYCQLYEFFTGKKLAKQQKISLQELLATDKEIQELQVSEQVAEGAVLLQQLKGKKNSILSKLYRELTTRPSSQAQGSRVSPEITEGESSYTPQQLIPADTPQRTNPISKSGGDGWSIPVILFLLTFVTLSIYDRIIQEKKKNSKYKIHLTEDEKKKIKKLYRR